MDHIAVFKRIGRPPRREPIHAALSKACGDADARDEGAGAAILAAVRDAAPVFEPTEGMFHFVILLVLDYNACTFGFAAVVMSERLAR